MTVWLAVVFALAGCGSTPITQAWQPADREAPSLDIVPSTARPEPQKPFALRVHGHWPVTATALEPQYPNYITEMRVLNYRRSVTDIDGERWLDVRLDVQADVGGVYRILPVPVALEYPDGRQIVLRTLPLFLEVTLEAARDVTDIRDIKPLRRLPWTMSTGLWIAAGSAILVALLLIVGLTRWWPRRHKRTPTAIEQLEAALRPYLSAAGPSILGREQAFGLSEAARRYVEMRHGLRALEMTGTEFVAAVGRLPVDALTQRLQELAQVCRELEDIKFRPQAGSPVAGAQLAARIWDAAHKYEEGVRAREARERGKK